MRKKATRTKAASRSDNAVDRIAQSARDLVDQVADAANDAARDAGPAINRAAGLAHKVVDKAASGTATAADWLDIQVKELNFDQEKLAKDVRKYIEQNPLKAVAGAAVLGFLIARLVR